MCASMILVRITHGMCVNIVPKNIFVNIYFY